MKSTIYMNIKKLFKVKTIFIIYLLYVFITGVLIFSKPKDISKYYKDNSSIESFYSDSIGPDRAIIINDPLESGIARIKIIANATKTLDISYYAIKAGESSNLFLGSLLKSADRGVQINILLDGISHGLNKNLRDVIHTFALHPNINLKFYEPLNILKPWTLNNRLHDKYILADGKIAIIGGRNIGDKYFAPEWYEDSVTNDRDIVIINTDEGNSNSVLYEMNDYFNFVWNHEYAKSSGRKTTFSRYKRGVEKGKELRKKAEVAKDANKHLLKEELDLLAISSPTNKITLIHNPIERFSKEPWVWHEITQLIKSAKQSVFIQSPYVIPSKQMISNFINKDEISDIQISILTNSLASTPNVLAYSGYMNHRKNIIDSGINVYELQSQDSIHAKSFVIDDNLSLIGSFNLDSRSANLSTESMVVIHSQQVVDQFQRGIKDYIDQSLLVSLNYDYVLKDGVNEEEVSFIKAIIIKFLSYITGPFEYLL